MSAEPAGQEALREAVRRINDAWVNGKDDELRELLHEDVMMVQPGFTQAVRGREACIASYAEFVQMASIERFTWSEPVAEAWGHVGVAWFPWTMVYTIEGQTYRERGHDLFVFQRASSGWQAVWRTLTAEPLPEGPDEP